MDGPFGFKLEDLPKLAILSALGVQSVLQLIQELIPQITRDAFYSWRFTRNR